MNSQIDGAKLLPLLAESYSLSEPLGCESIRYGFNHHYLVTSGGDRSILRLYLNGKYYIKSPKDFQFELDWLSHLKHQGIPVASPIPRRDGSLMGRLETEAGVRYYALFTFAPGETISGLSPSQARLLGSTIARLHLASDSFISPHHRYHLNERYLLDEPMEQIVRNAPSDKRQALEAYLPSVQALRERIVSLPRAGGAYGLIHGDLHGRNYHYEPSTGFTFFDFDHGGYGWRAYDLATVKGGLSDEAWVALLEGYRSERPFSIEEESAISHFQKARNIWDQGDVLAMMTAWGGEPSLNSTDADHLLTSFQRLFSVS